MACKECEARRKRLRDAIMHGKMADAIGETVAGLREMIGFKGVEDEDISQVFASGGVFSSPSSGEIPLMGAAGPEAILPDKKKA